MYERFGELRGFLLIITNRADHIFTGATHCIATINAHIPGARELVLDLDKAFYHTYTPACNCLRIIVFSAAVAGIPERSAAAATVYPVKLPSLPGIAQALPTV